MNAIKCGSAYELALLALVNMFVRLLQILVLHTRSHRDWKTEHSTELRLLSCFFFFFFFIDRHCGDSISRYYRLYLMLLQNTIHNRPTDQPTGSAQTQNPIPIKTIACNNYLSICHLFIVLTPLFLWLSDICIMHMNVFELETCYSHIVCVVWFNLDRRRFAANVYAIMFYHMCNGKITFMNFVLKYVMGIHYHMNRKL